MVIYVSWIPQYNTVVIVPLKLLVCWSSVIMVHGTLCVMIVLLRMMWPNSVLSMDMIVRYDIQ